MSNKVVKPVSFNKTKEEEARMLKHVNRRNFSGYVKKLILADMEAKEKAQEQAADCKKDEQKTLTAAERLQLMKNNKRP